MSDIAMNIATIIIMLDIIVVTLLSIWMLFDVYSVGYHIGRFIDWIKEKYRNRKVK